MRYVIAAFLIINGLIHIGISLGIWRSGWGRAWLPGDVVRQIGGPLMLAATTGFVAAGLGLLGLAGWWRDVTAAAALVSILVMVIFWDARQVLGLILDAAVLWALLVAHWPPRALVGP